MNACARVGSRCHAALALAAAAFVWLAASPAQPRAATRDDAASQSRVVSALPDTGLTFTRVFDQLSTLAPDSTRVAEVASLEIERDAGVLVLEHGTLALCRPVAGRISAAVFSGRGTFVFTPATEIERDQLQRFYGVRTLRRPFTSLVLLFSDSTLAELSALARFARGSDAPARMAPLREALRDALTYLVTPATRFVQPWVVKPLLDPVGSGLFYAHLTTVGGPLFFALDPGEVESVQLLRRPGDDRFGLVSRHSQEVVCQFRARGDTATARGDLRPAVEITHYTLDTTFNSALDVAVSATLDVHALAGISAGCRSGSSSRCGSIRWCGRTAGPRRCGASRTTR